MTLKLISTLFLAAIILGYIERAAACDCSWGGGFVNSVKLSEVVIHGKVRSRKSNSINLEVINVMKGVESRSSIRVWGDNGAMCRPYVDEFPISTEWIFALSRVSPSEGASSFENSNNEDKSDFAISVCGEFALKVVNKDVYGNLVGESKYSNFEKVPISEIKNRILLPK